MKPWNQQLINDSQKASEEDPYRDMGGLVDFDDNSSDCLQVNLQFQVTVEQFYHCKTHEISSIVNNSLRKRSGRHEVRLNSELLL